MDIADMRAVRQASATTRLPMKKRLGPKRTHNTRPIKRLLRMKKHEIYTERKHMLKKREDPSTDIYFSSYWNSPEEKLSFNPTFDEIVTDLMYAEMLCYSM